MRSLLSIVMIGFVLTGCLQEPQYEYRIGQTVDVAALAHSLGDVEPVEMNLVQVQYSYWELEFNRMDMQYALEVSKEGRIIGLWAMIPCAESNAVNRIDALKHQVLAIYRDKLECCGAAKGEIVADIRYDHKVRGVVFSCQDRDFAEKIEQNTKCVSRREKFPRARDT